MPINPLDGLAAPEPSALKADRGTARIPLATLPEGTKAGDRVSLTVTGVDPVAQTATVVADAATEAVPEAPEGQKMDAVDTSMALGPMDDLKSYLYKKTQEQGA